ncbi:hypothetical protein KEM52_002784, partial [Ascosphaera acerosa]
MLDCFEIVTSSGVVLWSRHFAPVGAHIVNGLISDVFVEQKRLPQKAAGPDQTYTREHYTLKWRRAREKEMGLLFVAVYHSMLQLPWVERFLDNIATLFVELYRAQLLAPHRDVAHYPFGPYFDHQIRECAGTTSPTTTTITAATTQAKQTTIPSP